MTISGSAAGHADETAAVGGSCIAVGSDHDTRDTDSIRHGSGEPSPILDEWHDDCLGTLTSPPPVRRLMQAMRGQAVALVNGAADRFQDDVLHGVTPAADASAKWTV